MDKKAILKKVEELVTPVFKNLGYDLVERELLMDQGRWVLRLYIDKDGGITIDDCTRASHGVEDLLDVEGVTSVGYTLEVSSPGINRPLRKREDFERFSGSNIRLKTLNPINDRSNYKGTLDGVDGDDILMTVDGTKHRIPLAELAKARLEDQDIETASKTVH